MKGIDHFVVVSKSVKGQAGGLRTYMNYLESQEHSNHQGTSIVPLMKEGAADRFYEKLTGRANDLERAKIDRGKGGPSVTSLAQSFVLTLPRGTPPPTKEQWSAVCGGVVSDVKKYLKLDKLSFFANAHNQDNPHLNIVFSRVDDDKPNLKLTQKGLLAEIKKSYSRNVLKHIGIDYKKYIPKAVGPTKILSKWQIKQNQQNAELVNESKALIKQSKEAIESFNYIKEEFKEIKHEVLEIKDEIEKVRLLTRQLSKIREYARKIAEDNSLLINEKFMKRVKNTAADIEKKSDLFGGDMNNYGFIDDIKSINSDLKKSNVDLEIEPSSAKRKRRGYRP